MSHHQAVEQQEFERFVASLENYSPAVPDALTKYYLSRAGFTTNDIRVVRLVSLSAQKFVADIANDAIAQSRLRQSAASSTKKGPSKDQKVTLTVDDLERALREYGVTLRKPPYFADSLSAGAVETPTSGGKPATTTAAPAQKPSKS